MEALETKEQATKHGSTQKHSTAERDPGVMHSNVTPCM